MNNRRTFCSAWIAGIIALAFAPTTPIDAHKPPAASPPPATAPIKSSTASTPSPRDGEAWKTRHKKIIDQAQAGGFELAFLGDSITEGWAAAGTDIWQQRFAPRHAINLGISGDRTQHVLWRLENGLLDALAHVEPPRANNIKAIVVMIGTNNSHSTDHTAEEIADGIKAIVESLHDRLPNAKILLLSIFPRGEKPNPQREKNAKASELASTIADGKSIHYLDIASKFLNKDGTLSKEIMPDFLHLSAKGYEIWADAIQEKLEELLVK